MKLYDVLVYIVSTKGKSVRLASDWRVTGSEEVIMTGIPVAVALATF